jgi:hypothetical protein
MIQVRGMNILICCFICIFELKIPLFLSFQMRKEEPEKYTSFFPCVDESGLRWILSTCPTESNLQYAEKPEDGGRWKRCWTLSKQQRGQMGLRDHPCL